MPRIKSVLCQVCFIKYTEIKIYYEKVYDVHKFMFLFLQVNIYYFKILFSLKSQSPIHYTYNVSD